MKKATRKLLRDYGLAIVLAVVLALFIRFFVIEAYRVTNSSMKPALEAGDIIFVYKAPYRLKSRALPERGDVVVFSSTDGRKRDFIKRVIGVPGDVVEVKKSLVILNGKTIDSFPQGTGDISCGHETLPDRDTAYSVCKEPPLMGDSGPEKVPDGSVFVLGDMRSSDGSKNKIAGVIPVSSLKGAAKWIWLSVEPGRGQSSSWFRPQFRTGRMFRRIK